MTDIPLIKAVPFMLAINAGAHCFEVANPRHKHEWRIWEDVKLPEGRILIPACSATPRTTSSTPS